MNRPSSAASPSRFLLMCFGMLIAALLSACGGGGGQVGLPTGTPLFTNAPAGATLAAGAAASYTVGGGTPLYSASSSNKDVATATVSGTTLTVTAISQGSATISVTDAVGAAVQVPVTVSAGAIPTIPPGSLFTTAAGSVSLAVGANATYGIGGGTAPYAVSSSNSGVASASVSGSNFTVNGIAAGSADVVVTDKTGAALTLSVTVGSAGVTKALFTTAPSAVTIGVGAVGGYVVGGGKPAYAISTSNAAVAKVALTGTSFTITGMSAGSAQVLVFDADGDVVEVAATVGSGAVTTALFTTAPDDVKIAVGATASYTAGGGKPAYAVSTSNAAVAKVAINGSDFIITGISAGTAQVVLFDAAGDSVSTTVEIGTGAVSTPLFTTSAASLTLALGVTETYAIGGGKPAYSVSSSNSAVAKVVLTGTDFSVTGVSAGSAQVVVVDALGASLTISVTVGAGAAEIPLFTTAPGTVSVAVGASATYTANGGKAPYTASSSNQGVVKVALTGSDFAITGISAGTAQISIGDAAGATVSVAVTVGSGAPAALYTTAPGAVSLSVGTPAGYTIGGGSGGYSATSSDTSVATVQVSGSTLTVTPVAAGSAKVLVFDSASASVSIDVTAVQTAPTAILVLPGSAAGNVGDVLHFLVSGGTPGYTVTMNNTNIATVAPAAVGSSGGSFTITLVNVGTTSATIVDANGQSTTVPVTVSQISTILRLSPSSILLGENYLGVIDLNIFGGTGPYRAFTSDQTLSSVSVTGSTLSVGLGINTSRCINPITEDGTYIPNGTFDVIVTAVDSLGASATSTVTIKDNGKGLNTGCP